LATWEQGYRELQFERARVLEVKTTQQSFDGCFGAQIWSEHYRLVNMPLHYSYGRSGVYLNKNQKLVAVKTVDQKMLPVFERESQIVSILKECSPQYFVPSERFMIGSRICLVTEYHSGQSLRDYLGTKPPFKILPESEALSIMRDFLRGYATCFKLKIIHRDLCPENIFNIDGHWKMSNFGIAALVPTLTLQEGSRVSHPLYQSPQVENAEPYTYKCDIWSFGCILHEMICGLKPFNDLKEVLTQEEGLPILETRGDITRSTKELVKAMLMRDESRRLTFETLTNQLEVCQSKAVLQALYLLLSSFPCISIFVE
jgi:serine/threonine protein kinase